MRHLEELKEKYKDGWWEGHDGYTGDDMFSDIQYLIFVVGEYKETFENGYERGKQANVRIGELLKENKELKELSFDLGKENEQLRKRNEELLEANSINSVVNQSMNEEIKMRRRMKMIIGCYFCLGTGLKNSDEPCEFCDGNGYLETKSKTK